MAAEMTDHLGYDKYAPDGRNTPNSRNGNSSKTVISDNDTIELNIPRDRNGDFEPQIIPKHQRRFVGTHASTDMYGYIGNIVDQKPGGISYVFGKKPFNGVLISLQKLRAMQRSHYSGTKDVPMMPWVPFKGWVYDKCAYAKPTIMMK